MDRRAFFTRTETSLSLRNKTKYSRKNDFFGLNDLFSVSAPTPSPDNLAAYTLDKINRNLTTSLSENTAGLTFEQISHLFKRTCFNASVTDIQGYVGSTAGQLVDMLFDDANNPYPTADILNPQEIDPNPNLPSSNAQPAPAVPNPAYNPTGTFLAGGYYTKKIDAQRINLVIGQWNDLIISCPIRIREKIVVFLSSYLVCQEGSVQDARLYYRYLWLLRSFTIGSGLNWNFKALIKKISIDPAMLIYLDGDSSTAKAPNENYGRELQELFTIGKGVQTSAGDYTNYSENDVRSAAEVLTGYTVDGYQNRNNGSPVGSPIQARFVAANHNISNKTFSGDYGSKVITANTTDGSLEISDMVDLIFSEKATALNIASRLYRTFVYYSIDAMPNNNTLGIVSQLADQLYSSGYDFQVVLKLLLKSQHFYDPLNIGCMIKDPVSFVAGAIRNIASTASAASGDVIAEASALQMSLGNPSEVAGWKATYESPNFFEWWISTVTVDLRTIFTNGKNDSEGGFVKGNYASFLNIIKNPQLISDPTNPDILVTGLGRLFFPSGLTNDYPGPITSQQLILLKGILLPGLPDFEWNAQIWTPAEKGDTAAGLLRQAHLIDLLHYMFTMAEYSLC